MGYLYLFSCNNLVAFGMLEIQFHPLKHILNKGVEAVPQYLQNNHSLQ